MTSFTRTTPTFIPTVSEEVAFTDPEIAQQLEAFEEVEGDIAKAPPYVKSSWTQNVIENLTPEVARQVLKISINNTR